MSRSRPSLNITLPPMKLHYTDGDNGFAPKTPVQHDGQDSAIEPPPPPRPQTFRVKRRRATATLFEDPSLPSDSDTIIPTIEMSEAASEISSPIMQPTSTLAGLLAPVPSLQRLVTPPKTPAARLNPFAATASASHEWELINDSRDSKKPAFQRSGSVCSTFSDSSVSSYGSSAFSAPNNGSCTSPESVATDPFMDEDITKTDKLFLSPDMASDSPIAKRIKRQRHVRWTPEMDQHLENTFVMYLHDPRVTPFKTLPGLAPPLGVCARVAGKAKRTWSQHRVTTPTPLDTILESYNSKRKGSPDTIRPVPSSDKLSRLQPSWPSDVAARRRLRKLVKSKPQLSSYYQRLLRTRSPSPFTSSSVASRSSEPPTSFSGRDMKMSLITSTAPSMQPEGPLAQLSSEDSMIETAPVQSQPQRDTRSADWFSRIGRSQAHQKSLSLQSGLSLATEGMQPAASLSSPFEEMSSRTHLLHSMSTTKSLGRTQFNTKNLKVPSLDSPIEMSGAPTAPRSLKRRFKSDEEKPRRPGLTDVFGPPAEDVGIVRNRGFSVGAVRANDNLSKLFEPPPPVPPIPSLSFADHEMSEAPPAPDLSHLGPPGSRSAPRRLAEPVPRLGSPFMETPATSRLFNTFPRSYIPTLGNPQPFQDRLRELAQQGHQGYQR